MVWPMSASGSATVPLCYKLRLVNESGRRSCRSYWLRDISNNVGPVKSFFQFFSAVFVFSWTHYSVHSEEWSCWFSSPQLRRPRLVCNLSVGFSPTQTSRVLSSALFRRVRVPPVLE